MYKTLDNNKKLSEICMCISTTTLQCSHIQNTQSCEHI